MAPWCCSQQRNVCAGWSTISDSTLRGFVTVDRESSSSPSAGFVAHFAMSRSLCSTAFCTCNPTKEATGPIGIATLHSKSNGDFLAGRRTNLSQFSVYAAQLPQCVFSPKRVDSVAT